MPSLRVNAYNFLPTPDLDIERIEVVSGPGSALYGPNSADGVTHIITKSPLNSEGTEISLSAGEQSLLSGSYRHAGSIDDMIGYKITGEYTQAEDWHYTDPVEQDLRQQRIDRGRAGSGCQDWRSEFRRTKNARRSARRCTRQRRSHDDL